MLLKAGYRAEDLMCYILSNYYVSLRECFYKWVALYYFHIPVCNCVYRKKYLNPKIFPILWTIKEIDGFKQICRMGKQIIKKKGFDPEIVKRLIRAKIITL